MVRERRTFAANPKRPIPALFLAGLYVILLAGKLSIGGADLRIPGLVLCLTATAAMGLQPTRGARSAPFLVPLAMLVAWLLVSTIWAPPGARLAPVAADLLYLLVFAAISVYFLRRVDDETLRIVWILTFVAGCVYAVGALALGTVTAQGRLSAFGGGPNVFVRVVCLGVLASVALTLGTRLGRWTMLAVPVLLMCAVLSGSRGGLVALLVTGLTAVWLIASGKSRRAKRWLLTGTVGLAVFFYLLIWPRVKTFVQVRFIDETFNQGYTSGRSDISAQSLELFKDHPIVGVGVDGYWALAGASQGYQYPHNILLTAATEGGLIGLALLTVTLGLGFRSAFRRRFPLQTLIPALAALFILVASLFSGYWYDTRFLWFYLAVGAELVERHRARGPQDASAGSAQDQRPQRRVRRRRVRSASRRHRGPRR